MKRSLLHLSFRAVLVLGATALGTALGTVACGYSEQEWQEQLAKYNAEVEKVRAANQRVADLEEEIENAKNHVTSLEAELQAMGLDVSQMNTALAERGEALANLQADMRNMRRALAEYKARAAALDRIKSQMLALRQRLETLTRLGLDVSIRKNRMIISLPGDILFDTGRADLRTEGKRVLGEVAKVIANDQALLARDFQVAGHTDNSPLKGGQFVDNWGLSLMRARMVLVFLVADAAPSGTGANRNDPGGGGLPSTRWSASGYGETDPLVANSTPENMQRNRRVELVVMPDVEEMLDLKSLTNVP